MHQGVDSHRLRTASFEKLITTTSSFIPFSVVTEDNGTSLGQQRIMHGGLELHMAVGTHVLACLARLES